MILKCFSAVLVFGLAACLTASQVEYVEVRVKARGESLQEAVNNALVEAVGRVNGKSIEAMNEVKRLRQSLSVDGEQSKQRASTTRSEYQEAAKGIIASYRVLSEEQKGEMWWEAEVLASVAKFKRPPSANRKRIAVVPLRLARESFRVAGRPVAADEVSRIFLQDLVSQLVQTRKFTVLDKAYLEERHQEKLAALTADTPIEELARLGQEFLADYIMVGTFENLSLTAREHQMQMSGRRVVSREGLVEVGYRILDVATNQIKFADYARVAVDEAGLSRQGAHMGSDRVESAMCMVAAEVIARKILNAIYPILVVAANGPEVTLNQGGDALRVGDRLEVYRRAKKLQDPYTKEFIGYDESRVGMIEIVRVNAKTSLATLVEGESSALAEDMEPRSLVCRPLEASDREAASAARSVRKKHKQKKEEIDELW